MTDEFKNLDPNELPSLALAYDYVMPSYDEVVVRHNAIQARLATLAIIAAPLTLAIPVLKEVKLDIDLASLAFVLAFLCGAVVVSLGLCLSNTTKLLRIDPTALRAFAKVAPERFQHEMLYWAGENFASNKRALDRLVRILRCLHVLFLSEIVLLSVWLVLHSQRG